LVIDNKLKQIDLLSSIAKKFNLVFIPDPDVQNQIIVEPYDYYIGTGEVKDWTDKISFDKGFTVQPALNFVESEIFLTDQEDGDDGNIQFKEQNNRIYGELHQYNTTDFKSQVKKIDTIFGPEIIRTWDNNVVIPLGVNYAASTSPQNSGNSEKVNYFYKGVKSKPKMFFNLGNFLMYLWINLGPLSILLIVEFNLYKRSGLYWSFCSEITLLTMFTKSDSVNFITFFIPINIL
jgi:hypothetical protein